MKVRPVPHTVTYLVEGFTASELTRAGDLLKQHMKEVLYRDRLTCCFVLTKRGKEIYSVFRKQGERGVQEYLKKTRASTFR